MNYSSIKRYDTANSIGISTTIFVSGCTHGCKNCFNEELWPFNSGEAFTKETEDLFVKYAKDPLVKNICILGGEPLQQDTILLDLLYRLKQETNKPIWLWSGYTFEQILDSVNKKDVIAFVDILIDGKFEQSLKDFTLKHRGSKNQRILDAKESLKQGKPILHKEFY